MEQGELGTAGRDETARQRLKSSRQRAEDREQILDLRL
jgi:hypothetical protein